ncbi:cysteine proteinase [Choiromyces venosus 120613-1]|uniref:Cysteine proteinase n=1 Tax=Choiromyces venosus 120613-1 TaxID=1336337 RepID=A0A3N4JSN1_9PEZI|nr:cysteine proteinase [Choiromyces venosus 120613-1]
MSTTASKRKEPKDKDSKKTEETTAVAAAAEDTAAPRSRTILPKNKLADAAAANLPHGATKSVIATQSFHEAVEHCKAKVAKIAKECRSANRKYRDFHFDLRNDGRHCLDGLTEELESELHPAGVARVEEIFDTPKFFKDGVSAGDIQQGATGDCWFLAAVTTVANVSGLVEKICVARDEQVGVYGFIFMRDGEWTSTIVDDQLYLSTREYHDAEWHVKAQFSGKEKEYNQTFAKGSEALSFAKCEDKNETWLPLLEKAYAKAHGDYGAIEGGWTGEAVEDLTGGVTSEVYTCDVLDRDRFWKEELVLANKDFLFAAGLLGNVAAERSGIISGHAYSVLKAKEVNGKRFVLIRNPWGCTEWTGPWSDGSKEWTSEWMTLLEHRFGDDGAFWMSYDDFLHKFSQIDRTRLFDPSWTVTNRWIQVPVPWGMEYSPTRFEVTVTQKGPLVIVLSQLDDRYFRGLAGQYSFNMHFRVQKDGETEYITRSRSNVGMSRSVNAELELEPGKYIVIFKITGEKNRQTPTKAKVVKKTKKYNRKKFLQIGMSCDLAFARATTEPEDEEELAAKAKAASAAGSEHEHEGAGSGAGAGAGAGAGRGAGAGAGSVQRTVPGKLPGSRAGSKTKGMRSSRPGVRAGFHEGETGDDAAAEGSTATSEAGEDDEKESEDGEEVEETEEEEEDSDDDDEENYWDAVACVGLRIYAQDKGLAVEVVHAEEEASDALDQDDPAKDAANESDEDYEDVEEGDEEEEEEKK